MTGIEDELTELLKDTVDAEVQWGSPVVYVAQAVQEILKRWALVPVAKQDVRQDLAEMICVTVFDVPFSKLPPEGADNGLSRITDLVFNLTDQILGRWSLVPCQPPSEGSS